MVSLVAEIFFPNSYVLLVYLAIFAVGIFVGGYFAFADLLANYEKLEEKINDLDNKKPDIKVFFQSKDGQPSKELEFALAPIKPNLDYESLVERKKKELLVNHPDNKNARGVFGVSLFTINNNYDQDVKDYLIEYREYLTRLYECGIDRAFAIYPFIENRGQYPANNVTIELIMPPEFEPASEHQCFDRETTSREEIEYYVHVPRKPQPFFDFSSIAYIPPISGINSVISNYEAQSNITGPEYEKKDGKVHIKYKVEKLVQHTPEDNFGPIWLWLGNIEQSTLWKISVRITSSDLRKAEEDFLFINIKMPPQ